MADVRHRVHAPLIPPVAGAAGPGPQHHRGAGFATRLHAAMRQAEAVSGGPPIEPAPPAAPARPGVGPHIVAGIVVPAPLPR